MKRSIIAFLASLMILSCHSQDCSTLPQKFSSYKQAIELVQNSRFVFTDEANTSSSSWISSASYYWYRVTGKDLTLHSNQLSTSTPEFWAIFAAQWVRRN